MLIFYLPALVADAVLEVCLAGLNAWELASGDPIAFVMVEDG